MEEWTGNKWNDKTMRAEFVKIGNEWCVKIWGSERLELSYFADQIVLHPCRVIVQRPAKDDQVERMAHQVLNADPYADGYILANLAKRSK